MVKKNKIKALGIWYFFAFTIILIINIFLDIYYSYKMARVSSIVSGEVYNLNLNHGTIVYVTRDEYIFYYAFILILFIIIIIGFIKIFKNRFF